MKAEELNEILVDLGYDAFDEFCGFNVSKLTSFTEEQEEMLKYAYSNPRKRFFEMDMGIINKIRETYDLLLELAMKENYFFIGANYKTLVSSVLKNKSTFNDPLTCFEDEDFIKLHIQNMKDALKKSVIEIGDLDDEFDNIDSYLFFLNSMQKMHIRNNLKKAIKILKGELKGNVKPQGFINEDSKFNNLVRDPNLWTEKGFNLFKYLFDNYYRGTKRQLTNIWFYLKENIQIEYKFLGTKEEYEKFIKDSFEIKITNFDKSHNDYSQKQLPILEGHRKLFESN